LVGGLRALVVAPDTDQREVLARLLSAEAKVPINHLRSGNIAPDDDAKIRRKQAALAEAPLVVSASWPRPATADALLGTVEEWLPLGVRLVFVDGTYLAEPLTRDLVRGLTSAAKRAGAAILVASKVVMPDERRDDWPRMEDLREYRSTADLVDLILSIHRPDMHDPESTRPGEADLDILKHRYGPPRRLTVAFQGHYSRFVDPAS
jgi:replicative DNA helicase